MYDNYSSEQVDGEEKYDEELHVEDYAEEEVSEEFAAMITPRGVWHRGGEL